MTIVHRPSGFIYLKSHKTASSSLEIYFVTNTPLGTDIYTTTKDVVKYGFPAARRSSVLPGFGSRFAYSTGRREQRLREFLSHAGPAGRIMAKMYALREHQPGASVRRLLGGRFFERCLKVTSVRNPWDAVVSAYEWRRSGRHGRSAPKDVQWNAFLHDFLEPKSDCGGLSTAQYYLFYPYLMIGDRWFADDVVFFEAIDDSIDRISRRLNLTLPRFSGSAIHEKKVREEDDYRRYFTDEQAEHIARHFQVFLDRFPYRFDRIGEAPT